MRSGGMRGVAGLVLALALAGSIAMPVTAFALPLLETSSPATPGAGSADAGDGTLAVGRDTSAPPLGPRAGAGAAGDLRRFLQTGHLPGADAAASDAAIPDVVLAAYRNAARQAPVIADGCEMDWAVLAGIGRIESRHGLHFGNDSVIDTQGTVRRKIIGPALDGGPGVSKIRDTDGGEWDGDATWDRAVGPMQFIPSSWRRFGQDGNGDGVADPHNIFDAALAAVAHLCGTTPADLSDDGPLDTALYGYNRSERYVAAVRQWIDVYRSTDPGDLPQVAVRDDLPPDGPVSPFPKPNARIAGVFGSAPPLASTPPARTPAARAAPASDTVSAARPGGQGTAKAKATSGKAKAKAAKKDQSKAPAKRAKPKPKPKPSDSAEPKPSESASPKPKPSDSASPKPAPSDGGDAAPAPSPAPDPDPEPATPAPEPAPPEPATPEPEEEPEPSTPPVSESPSADPVGNTAPRPPVTYTGGAATDWPKACRPAALWSQVAAAARAEDVTVAEGSATPVKGAPERLAVTWTTAKGAVWQVTTYDCPTGVVIGTAPAV